jgi:hypothetical protein
LWWESWLDMDLGQKLLGNGLGFYSDTLSYHGKMYLQDIGMWFYSFVTLGVFLSFILFIVLWWSTRGCSFAVGIVFILLSSKNVFFADSIMATLALFYSSRKLYKNYPSDSDNLRSL